MYKFINFPISISKEEYYAQKKSFIDEISHLFSNEKFSIYQIWETELLWVSDLDFLIILESNKKKQQIISISKKYELIDTPLFILYNNIDNLQYFSHHVEKKYISWTKISFDSNDNKNLSMIYSRKVLFFSWLRNFYIPLFSQTIDVKKMLSWIYDLRYPIFYLSNVAKIDKKYTTFIKDFSNFRRTRFSHQDKDNLVYFLNEAIDINYELIHIRDKLYPYKLEKKISKLFWRYPTIFTNFSDFPQYKKTTEKYYKRFWTLDRFVILPKSFDYRTRRWELKETLVKVQELNPNFINLSFDNRYLKIALKLKKYIDCFKIYLFIDHEKL